MKIRTRIMMHEGYKMNEKWSSNKRQNTLKTQFYKAYSKHKMLRMLDDQNDARACNRTRHDKGDKVCAKGAYVECMNKAWTSTCGAKCVEYTTNNANILLMSKNDKHQSLVVIGVQTGEKIPKRHFIKHLKSKKTPFIWWNTWTWWNLPLIHD